jgi:hypothetical protein
MPDEDAPSPVPPGGPCFSTWGRPDGPIVARDEPPASKSNGLYPSTVPQRPGGLRHRPRLCSPRR